MSNILAYPAQLWHDPEHAPGKPSLACVTIDHLSFDVLSISIHTCLICQGQLQELCYREVIFFPCSLKKICFAVELLQNEVTEKLPSETENLQIAFGRLQQALNKAHQYVDDVVVRHSVCMRNRISCDHKLTGSSLHIPPYGLSRLPAMLGIAAPAASCSPLSAFCVMQNGKRKGDLAVGRYLADTCAAVPYIRKEDFEQLLQDNTQDALLVMYLANLVQAHVALADKLGTAALPLL